LNICPRCLKHYEDMEQYTSPMEELGAIFLRSTGREDNDQLCPDCKEELGMMNLIGFNQ
jgi:hypothetical protein